ncbi:dnaJ protein subfamily C member 24 [Planoprotostelium fungivorum]|nr:dnaJ protein subfamily C member 24 [Planoprotostelium fungivorum]
MNCYERLGVDRHATKEEIKAAYQRLVLRHHPDKQGRDQDETFQSIQNAWEILRDEQSRRALDVDLRVFEQQQILPIFAEIDLDEMSYNEETMEYRLDCRCHGEGYLITEKQLEQGIDRAACGTCSLLIRINYEEAED